MQSNTPNHTDYFKDKKYQNVFEHRGTLYARTIDNEGIVELKSFKYNPPVYVKSKQKTGLVSIPDRVPVQEKRFSNNQDLKNFIKECKATELELFGNSNKAHNFIRENFGNPVDSFSDFHTFFYDIETAILDTETDSKITKNDWKPYGHERGAMAEVTSIQIYDTKFKEFIILSRKDWNSSYESKYGKVRYYKMKDEETLLKMYLKILEARKPAIISGWNSKKYDDPYLTIRIIRVLDKENNPFYYNQEKRRWLFNKDLLQGKYVKQLSPINSVEHKEVEGSYGFEDIFTYKGIFLEDYKELYEKYTYNSLTSYSLSSVATFELGEDKVNHDEHTDFAEFYNNNFDLFIEYGIRDVELLIMLDKKLMLLDLAKTIAYICGVNLDDIHGTIKQWNTFMFNEYFKKGFVLPRESIYKSKKYSNQEEAIYNYVLKTKNNLPENVINKFKRIYQDSVDNPEIESLGQKFAGGITRGTGKFWKWVFSLDFSSLYPSCIQWANIGIETLINPNELPDELMEIRAKYAIYYEQTTDPKELIKYDFEFIENIYENEENAKELESVLNKYNVSMTPNGMFFRKNERSILSQSMENIINSRKEHRNNKSKYEKRKEELEKRKEELETKLKELAS